MAASHSENLGQAANQMCVRPPSEVSHGCRQSACGAGQTGQLQCNPDSLWTGRGLWVCAAGVHITVKLAAVQLHSAYRKSRQQGVI